MLVASLRPRGVETIDAVETAAEGEHIAKVGRSDPHLPRQLEGLLQASST
jgi:hypothetical protein